MATIENKELINLFLDNKNESLIEKVRKTTVQNKSLLNQESKERISKSVAEDTPKYLIICLKAILKAVESGKSEVKTPNYFPKNCLNYGEGIKICHKVTNNIIAALREKGFEAYYLSASFNSTSYGGGIHILW